MLWRFHVVSECSHRIAWWECLWAWVLEEESKGAYLHSGNPLSWNLTHSHQNYSSLLKNSIYQHYISKTNFDMSFGIDKLHWNYSNCFDTKAYYVVCSEPPGWNFLEHSPAREMILEPVCILNFSIWRSKGNKWILVIYLTIYITFVLLYWNCHHLNVINTKTLIYLKYCLW